LINRESLSGATGGQLMTRRYEIVNLIDDTFAFGSVHSFGSRDMGVRFRVWEVLPSYGYLAGTLALDE
jgi:hypothetical protein